MMRRVGGWFAMLALGLLLSPLPAEAQSSPKLARVGVLNFAEARRADVIWEEFRRRMQELGYVEGRNVEYVVRSGQGRRDRLIAAATELAELKVHVIFARSQPAIFAAKRATSSIPIVMMDVGDPVRAGFVQSLARPGGNITGLTTNAVELVGKHVVLLKQAIPHAKRMAVLATPEVLDVYGSELQRAAASAAVDLKPVHIVRHDPSPLREQLERAISRAAQERNDALLVLPYIVFSANMRLIAEQAARHKLPTIFWDHEFASAGGFMSYGARRSEVARTAASYVDRILRGAKPQQLPIEQPRAFDLVLNLRTAGLLGITVPSPVMLQAAEVLR